MKAKRTREKPPRYKLTFWVKKGPKIRVFSDCIKQLKFPRFTHSFYRNYKMYADVIFTTAETLDNIFFWGSTVTRCNNRVHWEVTDRAKMGREAARTLGKLGGSNGTGQAKVRGDSNYYKLLAQKSLNKRLKNKLDREKKFAKKRLLTDDNN